MAITTKVLGRNPGGKRLERISNSPQFKGGVFNNTEETVLIAPDFSYFQLFKDYVGKPKTVSPSVKLPSVKNNLLRPVFSSPTVTWFGHSSYLLQSEGYNILVDPVFSGYASPVPVFGKAFEGSDIYSPGDMPEIDVLLLTHDHYDHLDYHTVMQLSPRVKRIITSLGVGEHLEYWGINPEKITEMDWWETELLGDMGRITATPARHFSGRGLVRAKTLWASFVLEIHGYRLFLGGDSGYGSHFKEIGGKFKSFDLAVLESGQYGVGWPNIHMQPEETVQAAKDLNAHMLLPVHWAKFVLSVHPWNEPPHRVAAEAERQRQQVVFPLIGEAYTLGDNKHLKRWWEI